MSRYVVDASVAAKWFLPAAREPLSREALSLLRRFTAGQIELVIPDLFWAEFANILWKAVRQGRWTPAAASSALSVMLGRALPTVPARQILDPAFQIAVAHGRSVYDALYVALAVELKAELVTADERLATALAPHLPVKWLKFI